MFSPHADYIPGSLFDGSASHLTPLHKLDLISWKDYTNGDERLAAWLVIARKERGILASVLQSASKTITYLYKNEWCISKLKKLEMNIQIYRWLPTCGVCPANTQGNDPNVHAKISMGFYGFDNCHFGTLFHSMCRYTYFQFWKQLSITNTGDPKRMQWNKRDAKKSGSTPFFMDKALTQPWNCT